MEKNNNKVIIFYILAVSFLFYAGCSYRMPNDQKDLEVTIDSSVIQGNEIYRRRMIEGNQYKGP